MKSAAFGKTRAFTLAELLVASAISAVVIGAVFSAGLSMQRCLMAAEDYAVGKADQSRLSDYLALDLRRALTVTPGAGNTILTLTMPDYYQADGQPRTPIITNFEASYGNVGAVVTVTYQKNGASIFRQENGGAPREIAANVDDFQLTIEDLGKVVKTQVSFQPRFQRRANNASRAGTTVFSSILLRNIRKDI